MCSKPPLGGGKISRCATELGVDGYIITKVIFTFHRARTRTEVTAGSSAFQVQKVDFSHLPEAYGEVQATVSTDIHELHLLALTRPNKVDNIKVLEVTADIVCKIDAMGRVAASCSPVSGVGL